jgi:hypothetical protein
MQLFDVANQRMCAKYVGGPFGSRKLYRKSVPRSVLELSAFSVCFHLTHAPITSLSTGPLAYMQYFWVEDDSLLLFSVLAIIIRRWSDKFT